MSGCSAGLSAKSIAMGISRTAGGEEEERGAGLGGGGLFGGEMEERGAAGVGGGDLFGGEVEEVACMPCVCVM